MSKIIIDEKEIKRIIKESMKGQDAYLVRNRIMEILYEVYNEELLKKAREENEAIDRMVESGEWQKQIDELKRKMKKS